MAAAFITYKVWPRQALSYSNYFYKKIYATPMTSDRQMSEKGLSDLESVRFDLLIESPRLSTFKPLNP
jgi:hypothetical protein